MPDTTYRYQTYCTQCDADVFVTEWSDNYRCIKCGAVYDEEHGIRDLILAKYYMQLYAGTPSLTRTEREEIESDRELMADEFHGRNLDGKVIW